MSLQAFQQEIERTKGLNRLDLENDKRFVRRLLGRPEGREALRQELGYNFQFADDALKDGRPLVTLLCPTQDAPAGETSKAIEAMAIASRPYCILTPDPGVRSSVVHWGRNQLLVNLRQRKQPTDYVLLVDDDMTPPEDALIKLLAHDVDIVAGACTVRKDPPVPNFRMWDSRIFNFVTVFDWPLGTLLEVGGAGTAFMLVKTSVLDAVGENYLSCRYEREYFGLSDEVAKLLEAGRRKHAEEKGNEWWFQFLPHPWGDGEFGEDLSFCFKARACGFNVWVDTSVCPGHVGSYEYKIDDYLSYQADMIAREQAKAAAK
jgi:hypothetical protein